MLQKSTERAIFAISAINYRGRNIPYKDFDETFQSLQGQIEEIGCSKIKNYNDSLTHDPKFTSDDFKDLTLVQTQQYYGVHTILSSVLQPISDKYQDKYMAIKVQMSFKYILVRK